MWQVQNADNAIHAEESRRMFRLVYTFQAYRQYRPAFPLSQLLIALEPHLRTECLASLEMLDEEHLEMLSLRFTRKVGSRSAGLLECITVANPREICDYNLFQRDLTGSKYDTVFSGRRPWRKMKVQFIHRTVLDFLTDTMEGRSMTGLTESLREDPLRAMLEARLVCLVEGILPLCLEEMMFLSTEMDVIQREDIDFIDVFDKTMTDLLGKRLGPAVTAVSAWTRLTRDYMRYERKLHRFSDCLYRDFPGLIMAGSGSVLGVEHLLATRGHGWTGYYKGHLFLLTFYGHSSIRWPNFSPDRLTPDRRRAMALLHNAGADPTTPQTFCYDCGCPIITRSPATEMLFYLVSNLLFNGRSYSSPHTELASWKDLADAYLRYMPSNEHMTFIQHVGWPAALHSQFSWRGNCILTTLNATRLRHVVCDILDETERGRQWLDMEKAFLAAVELVHVLTVPTQAMINDEGRRCYTR